MWVRVPRDLPCQTIWRSRISHKDPSAGSNPRFGTNACRSEVPGWCQMSYQHPEGVRFLRQAPCRYRWTDASLVMKLAGFDSPYRLHAVRCSVVERSPCKRVVGVRFLLTALRPRSSHCRSSATTRRSAIQPLNSLAACPRTCLHFRKPLGSA